MKMKSISKILAVMLVALTFSGCGCGNDKSKATECADGCKEEAKAKVSNP